MLYSCWWWWWKCTVERRGFWWGPHQFAVHSEQEATGGDVSALESALPSLMCVHTFSLFLILFIYTSFLFVRFRNAEYKAKDFVVMATLNGGERTRIPSVWKRVIESLTPLVWHPMISSSQSKIAATKTSKAYWVYIQSSAIAGKDFLTRSLLVRPPSKKCDIFHGICSSSLKSILL